MKKIYILLSSLISFSVSNSVLAQQTYNAPMSNYVSPNLELLRQTAEVMQKRHESVREYKDNVQDWIYKLRRADQQNHLKAKLDGFQADLDKLELRGDWANLESEVRRIENGLKRMISEFEESMKVASKEELDMKNNLAHVLYDNGWNDYYDKRYQSAVRNFTQLIDLFPEHSHGYFGRGAAYLAIGLYSESLTDNNKAIAIDSRHSMSYNNRGWIYFKQGLLEFALNDLNEAVKLDDKNFIAWDSKAEINFGLGNYQDCVNDCKMALSIEPNISNSYFIMGRANYRLGNKKLACDNWQKAKSLGLKEANSYLNKYCK